VNLLDYVVVALTLGLIVAYGSWKSRGSRDLKSYFKGDDTLRWGTIGLSIMATQASAITFLSTPGLGYEQGLRFVHNYLGLPVAMVIICVVFLPIYRKLDVYTAYEYLGHRFDEKCRRLGASLFLLQRGLAAGLTLYAPAIILSTMFGWSLNLTIIFSGILVILYTVSGGTKAVSLTQKWQMGTIMLGMFAAFGVLLHELSSHLTMNQALTIAGASGRLEAIDFSFSWDERYNFWSGMVGGTFLALSYFGTDQSQVQRYLSGTSLKESRFGLLFNGMVKIPMQFFILLLGALLFVLYQFERPPIFFKAAAWQELEQSRLAPEVDALQSRYDLNFQEKSTAIMTWVEALESKDTAAAGKAREDSLALMKEELTLRQEAKELLLKNDPAVETKDSDYIFIHYVLKFLPHGLLGLLVAVIFCAAMSSTASELNALAGTVMIDFYKPLIRPTADEAHYLRVSRWLTAAWGSLALAFALFAYLVENLIEAVNILGSVFYGTVLGIFLVAFFLKKVGPNAVFWGAVCGQLLVFFLFWQTSIGYLWFNFIGCLLTVVISLLLRRLD